MGETQDTPINGSVVKTNWIDDGNLLAWVEDPETGETWCESYEFVEAEKVE
jgi:hypothetical protein